MKISKVIKQFGWQIDCDVPEVFSCANVDVDFVNSETGVVDETQFEIYNPFTKAGVQELETLFDQFCRENSIKSNAVISVTIVDLAEEMEALA